MPNTDDCEIVRVYSVAAGSTIASESIPDNKKFHMVLEAEAGPNLHGGAGLYNLNVVVQDLTAGTTVANQGQAGNFGDPNWLNPTLKFDFPDIAAQGAGKDDHIYQAIAVVRARKTDPIVTFDESPFFVITPP